jgi:hypothetical protein
MNHPLATTVANSSSHSEDALEMQKRLELILKMQNDIITPSNSGNTEIVITHIPPDSHD